MERKDDRTEDPYRSPGLDSMEEVPPPQPQTPPSAGKALVVTLLLAVGLPIAAIVLLFAVCTALVALG
jgi:hypothetical protein